MLRQVLDNLLASLSEEYAMVQFKDLKRGPASIKHQIATGLKVQLQALTIARSRCPRNPKLLKTHQRDWECTLQY
jgi:hypothetical protein